jgi:hypothetical protein
MTDERDRVAPRGHEPTDSEEHGAQPIPEDGSVAQPVASLGEQLGAVRSQRVTAEVLAVSR